jgi:hypothetical protein
VTNYEELVPLLANVHVEFILVGGVAATVHGSARSTQDLDIVYHRTPENMAKLVAVLAPHNPYLRGAPPGLPFHFDLDTLRAGGNFTLTTDLGWLDLLAEIAGGGTYANLLPHSILVPVFGSQCRVLDLETLIQAKRAAGRPKDFEALAELELLRDRLTKGSGS